MFERLQNKCNQFHLFVISGLTEKLISLTYLRSFKVQLTWSTNKANMKTKEFSKEVRHKVGEKHHSGEGHKKISKPLIITLSTMTSIIKKGKTCHTTQTLPRSGHPSKLSSRASRKLVRDVTVNPTMTFKDQQGSMYEIGVSAYQSTISRSIHKAGLHGQWQERSHY